MLFNLRKRLNIRSILSVPYLRKRLLVSCIIAIQAREGITTTTEQAEYAYDKVQAEKLREQANEASQDQGAGPTGPSTGSQGLSERL